MCIRDSVVDVDVDVLFLFNIMCQILALACSSLSSLAIKFLSSFFCIYQFRFQHCNSICSHDLLFPFISMTDAELFDGFHI